MATRLAAALLADPAASQSPHCPHAVTSTLEPKRGGGPEGLLFVYLLSPIMRLPDEAMLEVVAIVLEGELGRASCEGLQHCPVLQRLAGVSKRFAREIVPAILACRLSAARPCVGVGISCEKAQTRICRRCLASPSGSCSECDECNRRVLECASCRGLHIRAGSACFGCAREVCGECTTVCSVSRLMRVSDDGDRQTCRSCVGRKRKEHAERPSRLLVLHAASLCVDKIYNSPSRRGGS